MKGPTKKDIDKSLKYSIADATANSVKNGIITNYIVPFAMFLGAGSEMIGFITSLPELFGIFAQMSTTKIIKRLKSKKYTCRIFKLISNLFWIPIMLIPFLFENGVYWLLLFLVIRMAILQINSTAWASWISDIVPKKIRGSFFGKRNMYANAGSFVATTLAGWLLGMFNNAYGFIIIFSIAFIANIVSNYYLGKIIERPIKKHPKVRFSYKHFLHGIKYHSNYSNFVLYRTLMLFSIQIVAPFWIVYVLKDLNIGYMWYGISIGVFAVVNIISQKYWGKMTDRFGDKKIMFVCSFLVPFAALIMVFITNLPQLMIERIFSGFVYAGLETASFNYLLNASPEDDSSTFIANYKLFAGLGSALGPITGGILIAFFADSIMLGLGAIQALFLISFFLRFIVASAMVTRVHSIRVKKNIAFRNIFLKTAIVYPLESIKNEFSYITHNIYKWEDKFKSKIHHK